MVATDEVTDAAIQSAAEEITDIDQSRIALSRNGQPTTHRPRTVSEPPVRFPDEEYIRMWVMASGTGKMPARLPKKDFGVDVLRFGM